MASKKRERKSDKRKAKLEKRRRKLQNKLRKVEEQLKKYLKASETASKTTHKMKRRKSAPKKIEKKGKNANAADSQLRSIARPTGARRTRSTPKRLKRRTQRVKHPSKEIATKAKKPKRVSHAPSQSVSRPKRARPPHPMAVDSEETQPAAVIATSDTAPGMTPDLVPKQP